MNEGLFRPSSTLCAIVAALGDRVVAMCESSVRRDLPFSANWLSSTDLLGWCSATRSSDSAGGGARRASSKGYCVGAECFCHADWAWIRSASRSAYEGAKWLERKPRMVVAPLCDRLCPPLASFDG